MQHTEDLINETYKLFMEIDQKTPLWNQFRRHSYRQIVKIINEKYGTNLNAMNVSRWAKRFNWKDDLEKQIRLIFKES